MKFIIFYRNWPEIKEQLDQVKCQMKLIWKMLTTYLRPLTKVRAFTSIIRRTFDTFKTNYNILALNVPGEGYHRNLSCRHNLISTFFKQGQQLHISQNECLVHSFTQWLFKYTCTIKSQNDWYISLQLLHTQTIQYISLQTRVHREFCYISILPQHNKIHCIIDI
jgi:hypothetical protein